MIILESQHALIIIYFCLLLFVVAPYIESLLVPSKNPYNNIWWSEETTESKIILIDKHQFVNSTTEIKEGKEYILFWYYFALIYVDFFSLSDKCCIICFYYGIRAQLIQICLLYFLDCTFMSICQWEGGDDIGAIANYCWNLLFHHQNSGHRFYLTLF